MSTELTEGRGAAECMFVIPRPPHEVPTDLPCVNPRSFVCHHGSLAVRWKGTASSRANSGSQPTGFSPCGAPYVRVPRCVVLEAAAGR
jgi:hypothetical protein